MAVKLRSALRGFRGGAGALDQRCTFQTKTEASTLRGGPSEDWVNAFECWCATGEVKGLEYPKLGARDIVAEKRQGESRLLFRIRYRDGITKSTHRIVYLTQVWNITDVRRVPEGRPWELEIDAIHIE